MSGAKSSIPFFTDNDVDNAVGDFLRDSGHQVKRLREEMLEDSADPVVAAACRENGWVLITHNVRHFKKISKDIGIADGKADSLCRIEMDCHQVESLERIKNSLPTIEFEWSLMGDTPSGLRISVGKTMVRVCK